MLKNQTLIVFGEDYNRHPHCLEHIINEILPYNKVLWVETIGMRSPKLSIYDIKRIFGIMSKWIPGRKKTFNKNHHPNLTVLSPVMLPFTDFSLIRMINRKSVLAVVSKELRKYRKQKPILITSIPSTCDYIKSFKEKLSIYFCVDEFSLWPGLPKTRIQKMEKILIEKSDLLLATSSSLAKSKRTKTKEAYLLSHGVDVNHFKLSTLDNPNKLKKICYYGLIDERCDQALIEFLAKSLPQCIFTIIGEIVTDVSRLKRISNIVFHRKVSYEKLPRTISSQDIFILPYHINDLTLNINPLKIKEYLATGRPVISTALPESMKLTPYIQIAENRTSFLNLLKDFTENGYNPNNRPVMDFLRTNESWRAKAELLSKFISDSIAE